MKKYPLSSMQQTLIEWKYRKKYSFELKTYDIHKKITDEQEILFKNKIKIENKGGTYEVLADPVKFLTSSEAFLSFNAEPENERLKDFLSDYDNTTYTKAQESESNTVHHNRFFEK